MFRKQFQFFQSLTSGFLNKQKAIDINTLDTGVRFLPMKKAKMPPNIEYKHTKPKNQAIETSDITKTSFRSGNLEINPYNSIPNRFVLEKLAKSNGVSTDKFLSNMGKSESHASDSSPKAAKNTLIENSEQGIIKTGFTPATTIEEANKYATETLGIKHVKYEGMHIDMANTINEHVGKFLLDFPELKNKLNFVGNLKTQLQMIRPIMLRQTQEEIMKNNINNTKITLKELKQEAEKITEQKVKAMTNDRYGQSYYRTIAPNGASGIAFNIYDDVDINKLINDLKSDVSTKYHSIGSDSLKGLVDHEMTHQLDDMLGLSDNPYMQKLFNSLTKEEITEQLSEYASKNIKEFISEGKAEFRNNPNPRPLAKKIGDFAKKEYDIQWPKKK